MRSLELTIEEPQPESAIANHRSRRVYSDAQACTFWKGRVALYGVLKALGVGPGDSVLIPGYTCFAVPSAVLFAGAKPVYVDIDPTTFNVALGTLERQCGDSPRSRVRAIVVQHTYGLPADLAPILAWARSLGIAVIEDCAHALGSRYRDQDGRWHEVGTLGDAAFFSSQWTKPVSTGLGGWAYAADREIHRRLCQFREHECADPRFLETILLASQVLVREIFSSSSVYWLALGFYQNLYRRGLLVGTSSKEEFSAQRPRHYAMRMSKFQQWLLERRLANASVREHRRRLQEVYRTCLDQARLPILKIPTYADPVLVRYPVRVPDKARIMREAKRQRVELGDWYNYPVDVPEHSTTEVFGYRAGMCPEGERAASEVINLPMHAGISEQSAERTIEFIKQIV